ncbi:HNH endonuclease [Nocardioides sp. MAH-18]|uniref:HNH endonuclease n=1 Tax=Nocardioides agri TaxID=2682843 RepID=A0A6L6XML0_9ACTN|nr:MULTISPECIES: HNH endonuclease signature motif containing protein [unclassified Nocardioides]MBA2953310.1 HNH endonuclease [Nocardioides sp. CGMCC 1.13656]MVQ48178.1 HNH endonuclease [Nocardioides sp. MAH-18]
MSEFRADPLLLGQKVVALLETGLRTATYKLAVLMALIDYAIEHVPSDADAPIPVPIPDLAHRVLELYWPQVRPFNGSELRQSTQTRARIPQAVLDLRSAAAVGTGGTSLAVASTRAPDAYEGTITEIGLCLAQQPLHRLQRVPGAADSECFLYDDSFLHDQISRRALRAHGDRIVLMPGVATALARLAGLLKPALEIMWVEDVRRMNRYLDEDIPDVAGHLFGRERLSLSVVRGPLQGAFGPRCFYCSSSLGPDSPIDHVLPWSLVGIDGLANLVPSCVRCNRSKWHALPALTLVDRVLARDQKVLDQLAADLQWPTQYDRVAAVARGIYRSQPPGSPTWAGVGVTDRLDLASPRWWLSTATS